MLQVKLSSDRRKAEDLDRGMVVWEMTDSGSGNSYPGDFVCEHIIGGGCELLLQLNNVEDGLGDGRRFELFFDGRVVGVKEFFDLVSDPDDKGEGPFE